MIKGFSDTETKKIFFRDFSRKLPPDIQRNARRKLELLNVSKVLNDMRIPPGNRLEKMVGDRDGQHSIRINQRWRICFIWRNGAAHNVEIVDYHRE